jgi:hypothetical protein
MRVNLTRGSFRLWTVVTVLWVSRWNSLRVLRLAPHQRSPSFSAFTRDSGSVQGLSYCRGIRTVVGMEPSASNERLDFALAEFDAEEPRPPASTFAVSKHAGGRRRARAGQLFCGRRWLYCLWIMIHQCTRSQGRIRFLSMSRKYQNLPPVGIASNDLASEWAIGLEAWPVALGVLLDSRSGRGRKQVSDARGSTSFGDRRPASLRSDIGRSVQTRSSAWRMAQVLGPV